MDDIRARGELDEHALGAHLMGLFVPLERGDDKRTTEEKVYAAWAKECDELGFPDKAEGYRQAIQSL